MPNPATKPQAEWILTFDDGPLPAAVTTFDPADPKAASKLLKPLDTILAKLRERPEGPVRAMFFLRGPAFPWPSPPPTEWFVQGVTSILADGHRVGLHCHRHDPDLWRNPFAASGTISADLRAGRRFFEEDCAAPQLTSFRPPYGGGGLAAQRWADNNGLNYHTWDIDSEDWLHHPDSPLRLFENQPAQHKKHVVDRLHLTTVWNAIFPPANDLLFHVSKRTAAHLDAFITAIEDYTRAASCEPKWVLPKSY